MGKYKFENKTISAKNYMEAANIFFNDTVYPNPSGCGDLHTVYHITHKGFAEVKVYQVGDKQGSYWGVQAARPKIYKIYKVG